MKNNKKVILIIIFLLAIIQFSYFGLTYFPTVDDNNQYGIFHLRNSNIYENVIKHYKLYNVRPLAFFTDAYIISPFWNNMYIILFIMILLNFLSAVMFEKIAKRYDVPFGIIGIIIFTLSPFLFQSTYWISASSRLVLSTFFCISSASLLLYIFDSPSKLKKSKYYLLLLLCIIVNILSTGYYEQTIAFNFFFFIFILFKEKKLKYSFIPITSTMLIGCHYINSIITGTMPERGEFIYINMIQHINNTFKIIFNTFFTEQFEFLSSSFLASIKMINTHYPLIFIVTILIVLLYILLYNYLDYRIRKKRSTYLKGVIIGVVSFFIPFLPFFILQNTYVDDRNFYISFISLGIIISSIYLFLISYIPNNKIKKIISCSCICITTLFFMVTSISILEDCLLTYQFDNKMAHQIIENVNSNVFDEKQILYINYNPELLNFKKIKYSPCNAIIQFSWAIMGKVQLLRNSTNVR